MLELRIYLESFTSIGIRTFDIRQEFCLSFLVVDEHRKFNFLQGQSKT